MKNLKQEIESEIQRLNDSRNRLLENASAKMFEDLTDENHIKEFDSITAEKNKAVQFLHRLESLENSFSKWRAICEW